jgi:hypothetical protein
MRLVKKLSAALLATGAGLMLGGCLSQDTAPESGTSVLPTAAWVEPGTLNFNWSHVIGEDPVSDIGCGPRETRGVWMTGGSGPAAYPVWFWQGPGSNGFDRLGQGQNGFEAYGITIDAGPDKKPWIVASNGAIYQYDGSIWIYRGLGRDIGIGGNGSVWRIEIDSVVGYPSDYYISKWNPATSSWNPHVNGGGVRIDVDPYGTPLIVNSAGQIWKKNTGNDNFYQIPGLTATDIGISSNGSIFALSNEPYNTSGDKKLYRLSNASSGIWKLTNGGGVRVSADATGKPWLVAANGTAWSAE